MMPYLVENSWPDISVAVHQCARYSHNPRINHGVSVKIIVNYFIGTNDDRMGGGSSDSVLDSYEEQ